MKQKWELIPELVIANNYKTIIDIGISKGDTVRGNRNAFLTTAYKIEKYYGVDPFFDPYYAAAEWQIKDLQTWAPFEMVKTTSDEAFKTLPMVDFVFVDGSHMTGQMCKDVKNYVDRVKDGGCIMGHEYGSTQVNSTFGDYKEITKFVDKFIGKENINTELDARKESQEFISLWWTYIYRNGDKIEYSKQRRTN